MSDYHEKIISEIVQLMHAGYRDEARQYRDDHPWCYSRAQEQHEHECWEAEREAAR